MQIVGLPPLKLSVYVHLVSGYDERCVGTLSADNGENVTEQVNSILATQPLTVEVIDTEDSFERQVTVLTVDELKPSVEHYLRRFTVPHHSNHGDAQPAEPFWLEYTNEHDEHDCLVRVMAIPVQPDSAACCFN